MGEKQQGDLSRTLGFFEASAIGVGTMIGAGVFVLPGLAYRGAGPSVILSFMVGGLIALATAMSTAELASGIPKSGGGYYFVSRAFGNLAASVVGWSIWGGLVFATAFYMKGFQEYFRILLEPVSGNLPAWLHMPFSYLILAGFVALNAVGVRKAASAQNYIVGLLVLILVAFALSGLPRMDFSSFRPFFKEEGLSATMTTAAMIFVAYCGFAQIASVAEEVKNPGRTLPLSLLVSVLFVGALYVAIVGIVVGVRGEGIDNTSTGVVAQIAQSMWGKAGFILVIFAGGLATLSSANASIMGGSRVAFTMGRDGVVTPALGWVHSRFFTPFPAVLVTGAAALLLIVGGDMFGRSGERILSLLASTASLLHLIFYSLINFSVMALRVANVSWYQPEFRTPLFPFIPLVGALGAMVVALTMPFYVWLSTLVILGAGLGWFLLRVKGRRTAIRHAQADVLERALAAVGKAVERRARQARVETGDVRGTALVPVANPATCEYLIEVARGIATQLNLVHIFEAPETLSLVEALNLVEERSPQRYRLLEMAREKAVGAGLSAETHLIATHDFVASLAQEAARANYTILGWYGKERGSLGRSRLADTVKNLPGHALVLNLHRDRKLGDRKSILIPYAGGIHARLGLEVARHLAERWGARLTVMRVVALHGGNALRESLVANEHKQLEKLVVERSLDAEVKVVAHREVGEAIVEASGEHDLVVIGASGEWRLGRYLMGRIPDHVARNAESAVLAVRADARRFAEFEAEAFPDRPE